MAINKKDYLTKLSGSPYKEFILTKMLLSRIPALYNITVLLFLRDILSTLSLLVKYQI